MGADDVEDFLCGVFVEVDRYGYEEGEASRALKPVGSNWDIKGRVLVGDVEPGP